MKKTKNNLKLSIVKLSIFLIILAVTVYSDSTFNYLTIGHGDMRYCTVSAGCGGVSTTFFPHNITLESGTLDAGNITSILQADDSDSYNVSESAGANPLTVIINFTNVTDFSSILLRVHYEGGSGHEIAIGLMDWSEREYEEEYGTISDMDGFEFVNPSVFDASSHINLTNVSLRLRHIDNGITSHNLFIDYAVLLLGTSAVTTFNHDSLTGRSNFDTNHPLYATYIENLNRSKAWNRTTDNKVFLNYNTTDYVGIGSSNPDVKLEIGDKLGVPTDPEARVSVGNLDGLSGYSLGEDSDNRGWLLWNNNNDYMYAGMRDGGLGGSSTWWLYEGVIVNGYLNVTGGIKSGSNGNDGSLELYSEQGATDYSITVESGTAMIDTYTIRLPNDPPGSLASELLACEGGGSPYQCTWYSFPGVVVDLEWTRIISDNGTANADADGDTIYFESRDQSIHTTCKSSGAETCYFEHNQTRNLSRPAKTNNTVYLNPYNKSIWVNVAITVGVKRNTDNAYAVAYVGQTNNPTDRISHVGIIKYDGAGQALGQYYAEYNTLSFIVPDNYYYRVNFTTTNVDAFNVIVLDEWTEVEI